MNNIVLALDWTPGTAHFQLHVHAVNLHVKRAEQEDVCTQVTCDWLVITW